MIHYKPPACAWLRVHIGYSARLVIRRSSEGKRKIKKKARLTCKYPDCFCGGVAVAGWLWPARARAFALPRPRRPRVLPGSIVARPRDGSPTAWAGPDGGHGGSSRAPFSGGVGRSRAFCRLPALTVVSCLLSAALLVLFWDIHLVFGLAIDVALLAVAVTRPPRGGTGHWRRRVKCRVCRSTGPRTGACPPGDSRLERPGHAWSGGHRFQAAVRAGEVTGPRKKVLARLAGSRRSRSGCRRHRRGSTLMGR